MYLLAEATSTSLPALAAVVFATFIMVRMVRRRAQTGSKRKPDAQPAQMKLRPGEVRPTEHTRWEVEMHDTARTLKAEIDTKLVALERLIREADRAAARLEAMQRGATPLPSASLTPPQVDVTTSGVIPEKPSFGATKSTSDFEPARFEPLAPPPVRQEVHAPHVSLPARPPRHAQIYALADSGCSAKEIASRLGQQVGEVELVLGLRNRG